MNMKKGKFHNATITITRKGYGQYILEGLGINVHYTDSSVYDDFDSENEKKRHEALKRAYTYLKERL